MTYTKIRPPRINHNNIIRKPVEKEYFINKVKILLA
jgi:hypothetical protein